MDLVAEQERNEVGQIASPDHPGMCPLGLNISMMDSLGVQPVPEPTVHVNETILRAASDPKEAQFTVGFRVQSCELSAEVLRQSTRAESANPGKVVPPVQASQQRLGATHRQTRDRPGITV